MAARCMLAYCCFSDPHFVHHAGEVYIGDDPHAPFLSAMSRAQSAVAIGDSLPTSMVKLNVCEGRVALTMRWGI